MEFNNQSFLRETTRGHGENGWRLKYRHVGVTPHSVIAGVRFYSLLMKNRRLIANRDERHRIFRKHLSYENRNPRPARSGIGG